MCMWFKITSQDGYNVIRQNQKKWSRPWWASEIHAAASKKTGRTSYGQFEVVD